MVAAVAVAGLAVSAASAGSFPPAVEACVKAQLGATAAAEIGVTRSPTAAEGPVIGACYADPAGGGATVSAGSGGGLTPNQGTASGSSGGAPAGSADSPQSSPAVRACMKAKLGAAAAAAGVTRAPTPAETKVIAACINEPGVGSAALTPAVRACLQKKVGAKVANAIGATGPPTGAQTKLIAACAKKSNATASGSNPAGKSGKPTGKSSKGTAVGGGTHSAAASACPTLATLVKAMMLERDARYPTTPQIACHAKKAKRIALPQVVVTTMLDPDYEDQPAFQRAHASSLPHTQRARIAAEGFPMDIGPAFSQGLPPFGHGEGQGQLPRCKDDLAVLAEALRVYQAVLLVDKAAGKPVAFVFICGPDVTLPRTEAGFRIWLTRLVRPRIAMIAKAAEQVKAEVLVVPHELEPDVILNSPGLVDLPAATRVKLAQELVSTGLEVARKHFKGVVAGWRGWQFHSPTADMTAFWGRAPMEQVSYKGYDIVLSSFFPVREQGCTAAYATQYMEAQLAKTTALAQRDGVGWGIWELDIFTLFRLARYGGCGADPRAEHDRAVDAVFAALTTAAPAPRWVWLFNGPAEWQDDSAFRKALAKRFTAFARDLKG